jgi:hypothetical protein
VRDDDVRSSCFASLDVLCAKFGDDVPYRGGLDAGFAFRGRRVPFLSYMKGIHRASAQQGPAALSINTSAESPYEDEETPDGVLYAYRAGSATIGRRCCSTIQSNGDTRCGRCAFGCIRRASEVE